MSRLDEIEARLAAATPGLWEIEEKFSLTSIRMQDSTARLGFRLVAQVPRRIVGENSDAELIAHAPADLAALLQFAREIEARHRPVHPEWVRPGDQVCEECTDAAAYAAGVSFVAWPCPTAAALQQIGGAS